MRPRDGADVDRGSLGLLGLAAVSGLFLFPAAWVLTRSVPARTGGSRSPSYLSAAAIPLILIPTTLVGLAYGDTVGGQQGFETLAARLTVVALVAAGLSSLAAAVASWLPGARGGGPGDQYAGAGPPTRL